MLKGLNDKSRMKREFHVRFCERLEGRFLLPTRPKLPVSFVVITKKEIGQVVSLKTITDFEISVSKQSVKSMRV
jgi:hypothetical protein